MMRMISQLARYWTKCSAYFRDVIVALLPVQARSSNSTFHNTLNSTLFNSIIQ